MMIRVEGLSKRFGSVRALEAVDFTVPAGTVLGLLGPNGAGKTTIVRILSTLERPDGGRVLVNGYDVVRQAHQVRRSIAVVGQYATVDKEISGRENLYVMARLRGLSPRRARARADEMIELFDLSEAAGRTAGTYSGGMRRRLDLAASLIGTPGILYLDEPSAGLDPHSRNQLWDIIESLTEQGMTVVLTTQHMEEAEALADDVVIVDQGRVVATGTPEELRSRIGGQLLYVRTAGPAELARAVSTLTAAGLLPVTEPDGPTGLRLTISRPGDLTAAVRALADPGISMRGLETRTPSLDEVFLDLTGSSREGL